MAARQEGKEEEEEKEEEDGAGSRKAVLRVTVRRRRAAAARLLLLGLRIVLGCVLLLDGRKVKRILGGLGGPLFSPSLHPVPANDALACAWREKVVGGMSTW